MRNMWVYSLEVTDNYFEATLIDPISEREEVCYVLGSDKGNIDLLLKSVSESMFIGEHNHSHDDILLNYIWQNKEVVPSELNALSVDIKKYLLTDAPLWRAPFNFYIDLAVCSVDLSLLSDYEEIRRDFDKSQSKFPRPLEGAGITYMLLDQLKDKLTWNYKKAYQYRIDMRRAVRSAEGRDLFNNYIFY